MDDTIPPTFATWRWSRADALSFGELGQTQPHDTLRGALEEHFKGVPAIPADRLDLDLELRSGGFMRLVGERDGESWEGVAVVLRSEAASYREHLDSVEKVLGGGSWRRNASVGEMWLSPNVFGLFGVDLAGDPMTTFDSEILPLIHADDRDALLRFVEGLAGPDHLEFEFRAMVADETRHFSVIAHELDGVRTGIISDVTVLRHAESERRRNAEEFQALAAAVPVGIYVMLSDGTPIFANDYLLNLLGVESVEEIDWAQRIHPDDRQRIRRGFDEWVDSGQIGATPLRMMCADGTYHHIESKMARIETEHEVRYASYVLDRTEAVRQKEILAESKRQLDWSQRISRTGSWRSDIGGDVSWSAGFYELLGHTEESFVLNDESFLSVIHPEYIDETHEVIERITVHGEPWDYEVPMINADGDLLWTRSVGEVLLDEQGRPAEARGVVQDITAMRHLETRVRRAEKMQALGELAGGIAHDFNNLLTSILGTAQLLRQSVQGQARQDCDDIIEVALRCGEMVNQLLAFSRRRPLASNDVDIVASVETVLKLSKHAMMRPIELLFETPDEPLLAIGDRTMIENAVLNVILNAIQAMPEGGKLAVDVYESELRQDDWDQDFEVVEGSAIVVKVSDTGGGIDPDHIRRVLDPFFTTRRDEGGTGLGLAMTYGTVRNHGGALDITSTKGDGTQVRILLPAKPSGASLQLATKPRPAADLSGMRALVVDDERRVRTVIARHLDDMGLTVRSAAGNAAARELIEEHRDIPLPFDIAVVDLSLRDGPGTETADLIRALWPSAHIVIISGYDVETALDIDHDYPVLQKPFTRESLATALAPAAAR